VVVEIRQRQAERSRETQQRLMEAAVECLVELGWAGTTTVGVAKRAGVSRGAQLHHFRTKGDLVAAAVTHIGARNAAEMRSRAVSLDGERDRTAAVVRFIVEYFQGDTFTAALELWVAARTDAELREMVLPLQAQIGRECHRLAVELLGVDETNPGVREAVQATLDLARGLALANLLSDDSRRRRRITTQWSGMLAEALSSAEATEKPAEALSSAEATSTPAETLSSAEATKTPVEALSGSNGEVRP
jgi:AcrR family transcriptional regulator